MSEEDYWATLPDTLSPADVARILRTGVPAVRRRLRDGMIPGHRLSDSWIIFKSEIRAWLDSTSNQPPHAATDPVDVLTGYGDELSYRDLMQLLGKTKQTVYIWLQQGVIPASNVGGRWIIFKAQLRRRLEESSNQTTSPAE
ncbi:helix-turn-helix domain-containing protein [Micromonospora sp. DT81.3]|uniref:helix-turn-helix domain-containing protein n=1 Tax=Micromonospora sp. DT81.3 TaxID=3416523 RepID=UPI003CE76CFA